MVGAGRHFHCSLWPVQAINFLGTGAREEAKSTGGRGGGKKKLESMFGGEVFRGKLPPPPQLDRKNPGY